MKEREKKRKSALIHANLESETCDRRPVPCLSEAHIGNVFFKRGGELWQKEVKIIKTFSAEIHNVNSISA